MESEGDTGAAGSDDAPGAKVTMLELKVSKE